jgi:signal transduction histidine kinase
MILGTSTDIQSQKNAQDALRRSQENLRVALTASGTGTFRWDPKSGEFLEFGENLRALFEFPPEPAVIATADFLARVHPDDRAEVESNVAKCREGADFDMEYRIVMPNGDIKWLYDRARMTRDANGAPLYLVGACTDITLRKRAEAVLVRSEKLAAAGSVAATLAHEINNPLESIVNLVYLAKSQKGLPENVREYLRAAEEELDRVSQLTRQALGFYREKTAATTVRVGPIISQLRTVFSPKTTNKRIDLQMEVDQDPEIVAVPGELRQLFANLLSNSIDAVPIDGTIRVRVSQAREFNSKARPGTRVTIADSGPGITPAHRSRIFEPFFTTKKEVGTGLGLWVSKGIVERHGGTIRLRSRTTPGCSGTVFSVFLPADAAEGHGRRESVLKEAV